MGSNSDKWKHFERLVAAIHQAADKGARVQWNEIINGRQFDVTIRFRGGLYNYLTVVECKDHEKAIPVEKVEAFVTKSSDAHADHAVMASTSGFQEGAQQVARAHNMTLIHVTPTEEIDLSTFGAHWAGTTDALHVRAVELEYTDGKTKRLSEEANVMTYYVHHVLIQCESERGTLNELISNYLPQFMGDKVDDYEEHIVECPPGTRVIGPTDGEIPLKPLARVHVWVAMTKARVISGPVMFDPYMIVPDVRVTNVATGEATTFSQHALALGVDNIFTQGKFYEQPQLATYYYCDRIDGKLTTIYLVESFQNGRLIQAKMKVETQYANLYVPVSDKVVIERLQRRLSRLRPSAAKH